MFKFIGKTLVLSGLSVGALGCLYGREQLATWFHQGKAELAQKIDEVQGLSGELRGIESRVQSLEGEIRRLREQAIKEEVEVKRLDQETADRKQACERLRRNLEKAQALLATAGDRFLIGGASYARADVEHDVADKLDLFKVQQETLAQLEQTREVHQSAFELAKENVARGEALRGELGGKVRLLQAKLEKQRAREVYADAVACDFDANQFNSELGEVRQLCAKFESKLEVKGRLLDERLQVAAGGAKARGIDYETPDRPAGGELHDRLSKALGAPAPAIEIAPASVVIVRGQ